MVNSERTFFFDASYLSNLLRESDLRTFRDLPGIARIPHLGGLPPNSEGWSLAPCRNPSSAAQGGCPGPGAETQLGHAWAATCLDPGRDLCRVIHRDVKDTNILLDENLVAKISDFGLSKLEKFTQSRSYVSTKIIGTFGYSEPDYSMTQNLTRQTDVYASGNAM